MRAADTEARRAVLALFTLLMFLVGVPDAFADDPAAPTGLRAAVYSKTAAELFWDRSDAFGLRYEVHRDGRQLAFTDGVSHFDDTLTAAAVYRYEVIAVDRSGRRSAPATVTLSTAGDGPATPTGLRAAIYSKTAAELFWNRPDVLGLRYEVYRDGVQIITTDGVSHFDDALAAATAYEYRVRAVDRIGRRSASATVRLTTPGEDGRDADGGAVPDPLVAPSIERIAVYSGTAAELFWQRPPSGSPVVRVEVWRDNLVLGTTDGTSFFDDTRSPGVDYAYTLVAIDAEGRRSDGGAADPGAGGDGLDTIRPDNAVALLAVVFDTYRGEPWGDSVRALPDFSRAPSVTDFLEGSYEELTLVCDNGGSATVRLRSAPVGRASSYFGLAFVFEDCQDGDRLLDGQIDRYPGRWNGTWIDGMALTVTDPAGTIRYSGRVFDEPGAGLELSTRGPVDFERSAASGTHYSLTGATTYFKYGYPPFFHFATVDLDGGFSIASDRTGGVTLRAETPGTLTRPDARDPETGRPEPLPEDWTFTDGSLRVTAPDGSTVLLEADNGDEASARVTVIDAAGARTSFDEPWRTWRENLRFD